MLAERDADEERVAAGVEVQDFVVFDGLAGEPQRHLRHIIPDMRRDFDGARFVTFDSVNTPELSQPRIQGLFLDGQGTLWINTFRGGLTSCRNGVFRE